MLVLVLKQNKIICTRTFKTNEYKINPSQLLWQALPRGFTLHLNQKHIDICLHKGIIVNNNNKNNIIWDLKIVEGKIAQMILNAFQAHLNQIR